MSDMGSSEEHRDSTNNEELSLDLSLSIGSTAKTATTLTLLPLSSSLPTTSAWQTSSCLPTTSAWPTTSTWQTSSSCLPTTSAWQTSSCLPTTSAWQTTSACLPTTSAWQTSSACLPTTSAWQTSSCLPTISAWQDSSSCLPTTSASHPSPSCLPKSSAKPRQSHCTSRRKRGPPKVKPEKLITPPFAWATERPATVHNFAYLVESSILSISGEVKCKRCNMNFQIEYDLQSKFTEVGRYISEYRDSMRNRAPKEWMNPTLPDCKLCGEHNCVKPVIPESENQINWLFLLLGQLLGCCTLNQLRYFCMHNEKHRTGSKNRVLYSTYLTICKQLDSTGPFDVTY